MSDKTMDDKNFFELKNVNKFFNRIHAVNDVSFSIARGEIHALLGENGAGKSTLMNLIAGVYQPDSGEMFLGGLSYNPENPRQARESGVSIVFQELSLFTLQTVADNIFAGKELVSGCILDRLKMNEQTSRILEEMKLNINPDTPVRNLSIGQQQWLEIARALADDAKILILDEPNSALNIYETNILFKIIERLRTKGLTIIYISHRLDEVFEIANRVTIMRDGQYITTLDKKDANMETVIPIMLNRKTTKLFERIPSEALKKVLEVRHLEIKNEVEDISFSLSEGEVLGLSGLVGSGIETVLSVLFGLKEKDSGNIIVMGNEISLNSVKMAMANKIAMVPSDRRDTGLILDWSILNNIALAVSAITAKANILNHQKDRNISVKYSERLNIVAESIHSKVNQLSGGNQQKVLLSKWLATDPKILILDDPTRGIDVGAKNEVYELIDKITKEGIAVILTSSEIDELTALSDRIILFRDGKIIRELRGDADKETILKFIAGNVGDRKGKIIPDDMPQEKTNQVGASENNMLFEKIKQFLLLREIGVLLALCVVIGLFGLFIDGFMTQNNFSIILKQMSVLGIITFGMTFVFATGEVDVSVGWLLNATMSFVALLMVKYGIAPWGAVIIGLCFATFLGACNGVVAVALKLPSIVVTLGTMTIFRGFALSLNGGRTISGFPTDNSFFSIGRSDFGGISFMTIVALVVFFMCLWSFHKTRFTKHLLLKGDNSSAAVKCGMNVNRARLSVMALSGLMVGVASMLSLSNLTAADTTTGGGYELSAIGAVVVGGTKMGGGAGTILGSLIGIVLITTIQNGLVFLGLQVGWRSVFIGLIILIAISIDFLVQKRSIKKTRTKNYTGNISRREGDATDSQ